MRRIIASLDIGSNEIKLIVGEIQKNKLNILACVAEPSQGIKKGFVVNPESAISVLKDVFDKAEGMLGLKIKKVLVNVPSYDLECFSSTGSISILSEDKVITHSDLIKAMGASIYGKMEVNRELVSILPTKFYINEDEPVKNPINMVANNLTIKDIVITIPKKNSEGIIKCLEKLNIEVIDICVTPLADYYAFNYNEYYDKVGAIVNIGASGTTVSIYNKGILVSSEIIDIGSNAIDNDIAYVLKIGKSDAKMLKERLAIADMHKALPSESIIVKDKDGDNKKVSQYDVSAITISRLDELFNLVKKQINLLTKKEISYIIVSGGLSELRGLNSYLLNIFNNKETIIGNVEEIGARNNKFSTAVGMIKYYNTRLKLRNVEFSIFSLDEQEEFGNTQKKVNISDNSILGKIYGYFFDN